ncbi:hypothetical protein [Metasolibacillus sp. FSL K6-0083]|uniref:hypothetical protein n=1 Tax=Metasolibacillus sp. FSL K6-0083 TaxID=2921416 RepID=UPI00315AE88C
MSKQVGEVTFYRKVPVKPAMNPPCKPPRNSTWQLKNSEPPIEPAKAPIDLQKPPIVDDKPQIYSKKDK